MDAQNLHGQVEDLVRSFTSSETHKPNNAIREAFASDAVLETPLGTVSGLEKIKDAVALHAAFTTENAASKVEWDEATKTATLYIKSTYALPLGSAPWPLSAASKVHYAVKWDGVKLQLSPDESHPVRSDATEPTKYHVSKLSTPSKAPRNRLLATVYHTFLLVVRLVAPYVITVLVSVMRFFQRHPLSDGYLRTGISATQAIIIWVLGVFRSYIPFLKTQGSKKRAERVAHAADTSNDVPSSPATQDFPRPAAKRRQSSGKSKAREDKVKKEEAKKEAKTKEGVKPSEAKPREKVKPTETKQEVAKETKLEESKPSEREPRKEDKPSQEQPAPESEDVPPPIADGHHASFAEVAAHADEAEADKSEEHERKKAAAKKAEPKEAEPKSEPEKTEAKTELQKPEAKDESNHTEAKQPEPKPEPAQAAEQDIPPPLAEVEHVSFAEVAAHAAEAHPEPASAEPAAPAPTKKTPDDAFPALGEAPSPAPPQLDAAHSYAHVAVENTHGEEYPSFDSSPGDSASASQSESGKTAQQKKKKNNKKKNK